MSQFEFFMTFYGLLLGLAVAELLSGFANLARASSRPKLGLLTPMLGIFVFLQIITSLLDAWRKLQSVSMSLAGFALPTAIGVAYFFAAIVVVPRSGEVWSSLDDYYFARRKWSVGLLMCVSLCTLCIELPQSVKMVTDGDYSRFAYYAVANILLIGFEVLALFGSRRWVALSGLVLAILWLLYFYGNYSAFFFPQTLS